ncbi:MAG TPA: ABC transporter permease [Chryseolinea sp.]|nr:ABC transporter permease [Chryseolinea sp.]
MLFHYIRLISRGFRRFRSVFVINLLGLSTALTSVLLIYLWVNDELSVDRYNQFNERLLQIKQNTIDDGRIHTGSGTPGILARALSDEIPEVEHAVAYVPWDVYGSLPVVQWQDKRFKTKTQFASKDFFQVFSLRMMSGNAATCLADKKSVVVTAELAQKLFGSTDGVVGKTISWKEWGNEELFTITGVCESPPPNATMQFDLLLNYELFLKSHDWLLTWDSSDPYTVVLLRANADAASFRTKISDFISRKDPKSKHSLVAQAYADGYLHGNFENGVNTGGRIQYIKLYSLIGIFILAIAAINYTNLSTAKAARRIRDVGIQKAIGAERSWLIFQQLGESCIVVVIAMILALLFADLLLKPFNVLTGKKLALSLDPSLIATVVGVVAATGLMAGAYPAFYLSRFSPAATLRGVIHSGRVELFARRALVVFQFAVSVSLIMGALVVYRQLDFIHHRQLGYDRERVLHFDTENISDAYLNELKGIAGVAKAGRFYHDLLGRHGSTGAIGWPGRDPEEHVNFGNLEMGYDLIETMGFVLAEGKPFHREFGSLNQIIFNESAIKAMGLNNPIGTHVTLWGEDKEIVGVVKDFNFESLYSKVGPCFLQLVPMVDGYPSRVMVKLTPGDQAETIARMEQFFRKYNPGLAFDYAFLDDDYQRLYQAEQRVATLSRYFSAITVVIGCLGLFGLAAFTAERRAKEIGIRKVLGSTNAGIVILLSAEFLTTVLVAVVVAVPVSHLVLRSWLSGFEYRIDIPLYFYALAAGLAIVIALVTVGSQAYKAAVADPAKVLRVD